MPKNSRPSLAAVVLAAGRGKRLKSKLPKVLHPMAGQPLLAHVLESLDELGVGRVLVVIGHLWIARDEVLRGLFESGSRGFGPRGPGRTPQSCLVPPPRERPASNVSGVRGREELKRFPRCRLDGSTIRSRGRNAA